MQPTTCAAVTAAAQLPQPGDLVRVTGMVGDIFVDRAQSIRDGWLISGTRQGDPAGGWVDARTVVFLPPRARFRIVDPTHG